MIPLSYNVRSILRALALDAVREAAVADVVDEHRHQRGQGADHEERAEHDQAQQRPQALAPVILLGRPQRARQDVLRPRRPSALAAERARALDLTDRNHT